jgi:hypothetical protein
MEKMKDENKVDQCLSELNHLKRVDAPPFLITRIEAQLTATSSTQWERARLWVISISCIMLLAVNTVVVLSPSSESSGETALLQGFGFVSNNQIYSDHD